MEVNGFEPMTPCVQGRCSSQLSYTPNPVWVWVWVWVWDGSPEQI